MRDGLSTASFQLLTCVWMACACQEFQDDVRVALEEQQSPEQSTGLSNGYTPGTIHALGTEGLVSGH